MSDQPAAPPTIVSAGLPAFMQKFGFNPVPVDDLIRGSTKMLIASLGKDGEIRIKKGKEVMCILPIGSHILGVPIKPGTPNVWFKGEGDDKPTCKSDAGVIGIGDIGDGKTQRACASCPNFQWGSDPKGGNGKACKESIVLAISCAGIIPYESEGKNAIRPITVGDDKLMSHTWWFDADENDRKHAAGPWWIDSYVHPDPLILRITTSSFGEWDKTMAEIKAIIPSGNWPLEGTVWKIGGHGVSTGGNHYGVWDFEVTPIDNDNANLMEMAQAAVDHSSIKTLSIAGQDPGVVRFDPAKAIDVAPAKAIGGPPAPPGVP